jgi:hypothetical protein
MIDRGDLPSFALGGKLLRVRTEDLEAFERRSQIVGPSPIGDRTTPPGKTKPASAGRPCVPRIVRRRTGANGGCEAEEVGPHLSWKTSDAIRASIMAVCGVALYFVPASGAVVGQGVYVSNPTMACPSIAALERYKRMAMDNTEQATKKAPAAGCRVVDSSEQGLTSKVAGASLCVIFTAARGACLWISAAAPSGRVAPGANQDGSTLPASSSAFKRF